MTLRWRIPPSLKDLTQKRTYVTKFLVDLHFSCNRAVLKDILLLEETKYILPLRHVVSKSVCMQTRQPEVHKSWDTWNVRQMNEYNSAHNEGFKKWANRSQIETAELLSVQRSTNSISRDLFYTCKENTTVCNCRWGGKWGYEAVDKSTFKSLDLWSFF